MAKALAGDQGLDCSHVTTRRNHAWGPARETFAGLVGAVAGIFAYAISQLAAVGVGGF
ncbi:hypothetical protein [Streptomyces sp. NPDC092952]|uniref:hypothetical protein n=1 Tax=Streptomyces sp. NPDC092952 TaxID=3366018 RepID=UPI00381B7B3C